jgi:hypothetical protein
VKQFLFIYKACEVRKYGVPNVLFVGFSLRKTLQKLLRDEYFGGEHNTANGTFYEQTLIKKGIFKP